MDSFLGVRSGEQVHGAGRSDQEEHEVMVGQEALDTVSETSEEGPVAREESGGEDGRGGGEEHGEERGGEQGRSGGEDRMDIEDSE